MSYSLAVKNGDLVQAGSALGIVYGWDKLAQDLQMWMLQTYQSDRFHVDMGSILPDMIGGVVGNATAERVRREINRVLDNYQRLQRKVLKETPKKLSLTEILYSIDDVTVSINYDTVSAAVKVTSAGSSSGTVNVTQSL
ncbi:hypothetical protein [Mycolicibacter kumamotonensis]|uniref:DUF2634 domain-containing protein n=1 Tax=Mycolicibacter kumamotonensis TaxID=354243 RepID=A0A1B8SLY9_9MYCO|nr:hypothetical protein [Mycolicibacter kumamotonensis]OBY33772.1 hypothetical protein ACT18_00825 [Mycolicibacter kumamotonensis]